MYIVLGTLVDEVSVVDSAVEVEWVSIGLDAGVIGLCAGAKVSEVVEYGDVDVEVVPEISLESSVDIVKTDDAGIEKPPVDVALDVLFPINVNTHVGCTVSVWIEVTVTKDNGSC